MSDDHYRITEVTDAVFEYHLDFRLKVIFQSLKIGYFRMSEFSLTLLEQCYIELLQRVSSSLIRTS